jgi:hypothetical protein
MNSNIIHPQIFAHHNCSEIFDIQVSGCSFEGLIKMSKRSHGGIVTVTFNSNFLTHSTCTCISDSQLRLSSIRNRTHVECNYILPPQASIEVALHDGIQQITDVFTISAPVTSHQISFPISPHVVFQSGPAVCIQGHVNDSVTSYEFKCFFGEIEGLFSGSIGVQFTCCARSRLLPQFYAVEVIGSSASDSVVYSSSVDVRSSIVFKVVLPQVFFRLATENVYFAGTFSNLTSISIQCILIASQKRFVFEAKLFNSSMIVCFDVLFTADASFLIGLQDDFGQQISVLENIDTRMRFSLMINSLTPVDWLFHELHKK